VSLRTLAFYLPQFHPTAENDQWWGNGFTEWTNVVRARPRFVGHEQPILPADLGFYDLRLDDVREAQAALARAHGIDGFVYHHYWFHGHRVLGLPLDRVLSSGQPDFPFCLCWANESWSRRWDGGDTDVLIEQRHSPEDDEAHIRWLLPVLEDSRYVRVDGKPLLLIHRAAKLPDPIRTTELWRRRAEQAGYPGLFLVAVESHGYLGEPAGIGFDANVEFQPSSAFSAAARAHVVRTPAQYARYGRLFPMRFQPGSMRRCRPMDRIKRYDSLVALATSASPVDYLRFPCVTPAWDNSARRRHGARILHGSTPDRYRDWVTYAARRALNVGGDRALLFVNAWNEWAEGCVLEPTAHWGHSYLEAHRRGLEAVG
jgi:lipopolysaccharide biosynthesis protein